MSVKLFNTYSRITECENMEGLEGRNERGFEFHAAPGRRANVELIPNHNITRFKTEVITVVVISSSQEM